MGLVVLIDEPGYRLCADRKIIKCEETSVVAEIAEAGALAQRQIDRMLKHVRESCAKRTEDGYRAGLRKAERSAAQRAVLTEIDRLSLLQSLQPVLVDVVVDAVGLLAKGLDRRLLLARTLETLQPSLRDVSWARLRVHPDAASAARTAIDEFDRASGLARLARVVEDDSLPRDACVFESDLGKVDASLDTQLLAIRAAISDAMEKLAVMASTDEDCSGAD